VDQLLEIVARGVSVYDLSRPMEFGMPRALVHPEFRMHLARRHGDAYRPDGTSASSEIIITGGHVGTHVDALAHFSLNGQLHGGVSAEEAQRGGRFSSHGIDEVAPQICRGVLLDVARVEGVECLPGGHGIDRAQLERAATAHGVDLRQGDVVLVRTGWSMNFSDPDAYRGHATGVPGVTEDGAAWLADQGSGMQGSDTINYEQIHAGQGSRLLPVHRLLLTQVGINIIETCNLETLAADGIHEFVVVVAPINVVGATGAPMRLLALTDGRR
jgi:kynurenine formamidase